MIKIPAVFDTFEDYNTLVRSGLEIDRATDQTSVDKVLLQRLRPPRSSGILSYFRSQGFESYVMDGRMQGFSKSWPGRPGGTRHQCPSRNPARTGHVVTVELGLFTMGVVFASRMLFALQKPDERI